MKEVTEWDNNPREMWVWDDDGKAPIKAFVVFMDSDVVNYPVLAIETKGRGRKASGIYDGWRRIGCLFCPMSTKREKQRQCREYPKYKDAFIRAFDRMIARRRADWKQTTWKNGEACFDWWIKERRPADKNDGFTQIDFL